MMHTFASSPGWNDIPATRIQSFAPLTSVPMMAGATSSAMPTSMIVYL